MFVVASTFRNIFFSSYIVLPQVEVTPSTLRFYSITQWSCSAPGSLWNAGFESGTSAPEVWRVANFYLRSTVSEIIFPTKPIIKDNTGQVQYSSRKKLYQMERMSLKVVFCIRSPWLILNTEGIFSIFDICLLFDYL